MNKQDNSTLTIPNPFWTIMPKDKKLNLFDDIIYESPLCKQTKMFKRNVTRYYILYKEYLAYKRDSDKKFIEKFTQLNDLLVEFDISSPRYYIKMKKKGNEQVIIELSTQDKIIFETWKKHLVYSCSRYNFNDNYIITNTLGAGNYAKVYLATRIIDSKQFAIKHFNKKTIIGDLRIMPLIKMEIKILKACDHPRIIKIYESYETDEGWFLVLEYMKGGQLLEYLKKDGRYSEEKSALIVKGILEGLIYLHKKKIIHRDLKPDNILFENKDDFNSIKIADFGFATFLHDINQNLVRCGTPGYVAPEVLTKSDDQINVKADIFSLGCILFKIMTGNTLFKGGDLTKTLKLNKECTIEFDSFLLKNISNIGIDFLKNLLEKNSKLRINAEGALKHPFIIKYDHSNERQNNELIKTDILNKRAGLCSFTEKKIADSPTKNENFKKKDELQLKIDFDYVDHDMNENLNAVGLGTTKNFDAKERFKMNSLKLSNILCTPQHISSNNNDNPNFLNINGQSTNNFSSFFIINSQYLTSSNSYNVNHFNYISTTKHSNTTIHKNQFFDYKISLTKFNSINSLNSIRPRMSLSPNRKFKTGILSSSNTYHSIIDSQKASNIIRLNKVTSTNFDKNKKVIEDSSGTTCNEQLNMQYSRRIISPSCSEEIKQNIRNSDISSQPHHIFKKVVQKGPEDFSEYYGIVVEEPQKTDLQEVM